MLRILACKRTVLNSIFNAQPLKYSITNQTIVVTAVEKKG